MPTHLESSTPTSGHSNVKAFITHAGFNSILEACTYGVPLVTIPLFADQFSNFKRVERRGVALAVQKTELGVKKLSEALEKILKNESYSQNAKRLSNLIRKKPGKQSELVRQWIEYNYQPHCELIANDI
uniref:glucuronosyltransferase n=1 Tax=Romanomermis culicivorax TaxID=13658 RepID=A0A915KY27_ROMCU